MEKIGILGGTFNPIHIGHLILAQNALEQCRLDKVLIMPSGVSYFKNQAEIVSKKHRINMVKEAIKNHSAFELSTIETDREGNSYTYETILELKKEARELYYIIGADTLFSIETWKNPDIIIKNSILVCSRRDGIPDEALYAKKVELENKFKGNIIILDTPEVNISSSNIRKILENGKTGKYYFPDGVMEYIKNNVLYK